MNEEVTTFTQLRMLAERSKAYGTSLAVDITQALMDVAEVAGDAQDAADTAQQGVSDLKEELENLNDIKDFNLYWCLWSSGTERPPQNDQITYAICGTATCGLTICGLTEGDFWTTTQPYTVDNLYKWVKVYIEFQNGTEKWLGPYCLTDNYTRSQTNQFETNLAELQDQFINNVNDTADAINALDSAISALDSMVEQVVQAVDEAQSTADAANSAAEAAQNTANTANSAAQTAQSAAETAQSMATAAQSTASSALSAAEEITEKAITSSVQYFCLWYNSTPPDDGDLTAAICGTAVCGMTVCGVTDGILWSTDQPTVVDGLYKWIRWFYTYGDGHTEWGQPYCLTDEYTREVCNDLESSLSTAQGEITQVQSAVEEAQSTAESAMEAAQTAQQTAGALASSSTSATLSSSSWSGSSAPYTQTVSVSGITSDTNGIIGLAQGLTASQYEAAAQAMLAVQSQSSGSIVIAAYGDKPSVNIPISIIILG